MPVQKTSTQLSLPGENNLLSLFLQCIRQENLFQHKDQLLVTVSGGVDSVVLCELCKQAGFDFAIAHCNFQLREAESDEDETFVEALAKKYAVEIFIKKYDTKKYAEDNRLGIQAAARELRYNWFATIINKDGNPFNHVLTAHHANDNIETLLMNFFKGTGINGLQGIMPKQKYVAGYSLIRPLLFARKEQLALFAEVNHLSYRQDSSNAMNKYTRNFLRNELLPALKNTYPAIEENLADNINRFREISILYHESVAAEKKKLLLQKGNEIHIPVLKLLKVSALSTIVYEIIRQAGFSSQQVNEVIKLLHSGSGKYVVSSSHRILRNRAWLIISPLKDAELQHYLIEDATHEIHFPAGRITIERVDISKKIVADSSVIMLDGALVKFPLLLRKWKQGDYFYPLGMKKKKKLSRFFGDQKMSLIEKEKTWIIESDKKILWILGRRIDDRFKVTPQTAALLRFVFLPAE